MKCETCGQERPEPVKLKALPRTDCFRAWQIGNNGIIELHSRLRHGTADKTRAELSAAGYDTTGLAEDGSERLVSESEVAKLREQLVDSDSMLDDKFRLIDEAQTEIKQLRSQLAAKDDAELWTALRELKTDLEKATGFSSITDSVYDRLASIIDAREQPAEPKWRPATETDIIGCPCRVRNDERSEWCNGRILMAINRSHQYNFICNDRLNWQFCEVEDK